MRVLFLCTARGGSKGVPGKNLREIAGIPLVGYKIISAARTNIEKRIICSTDSEEIAAVAREYGAETPFMRPAELARDDSKSMDVIIHAMDWLIERGDAEYDGVMLMEPSAPFATHDDFQRSIATFQERGAHSVIGMREVVPHPVWMAELGQDGRMDKHYEQMAWAAEKRRQDFPKVYTMNGALYLMQWDHLLRTRERYTANSFAHVMPGEYSIEIDGPHDLRFAEFVVETGLVNLSFWK